MQSDQTTIGVVVEIWHQLEKDLKVEDQPIMIKKAFVKRKDMALGSDHYLANMLDHRFLEQNLTQVSKTTGFRSSKFNKPRICSACYGSYYKVLSISKVFNLSTIPNNKSNHLVEIGCNS
ncbi:hypothetical protein JTB14_022966 [Gonioctena quinquepunctata]|nr:hypothetical protein JTB14_022966 [Gonioctena quinquepunctata]